MDIERIEADLLIVGSGFAGLWAAIRARRAGVERVAVVEKAAIAMSSQSRLCAGATIYCLPEDDTEVWLRDIVEANGFLSRQLPGPAAIRRVEGMIDSIDEQKCSGCDICFQVCPCAVFRRIPEKRLVRIAYRDDCQTCFACELDCPEHAIQVGPTRSPRAQAW